MQNGAFHARHKLHNGRVAHVLNQLVDDVVAQIAVGHLPSPEAQAGLYLIAIGEKLQHLVLLGLVVVHVHGHGELDLLDRNHLLLLFRGPFALFLLVEEAAVILDAADWRNRIGGNLHQVETPFTGEFQRFKRRQNPQLLAVFVDYADFARAYLLVDANKGLCRTFVECDGAPPKVVPARLRNLDGIATDTGTQPEYSIGLLYLNKGLTGKSHAGSLRRRLWECFGGKRTAR